MNLPLWVQQALHDFTPPLTGKVVLELELYQGGVTKIELGGVVRKRPPAQKGELG